MLKCYVDASSRDTEGLITVAGYLFDSKRVRPFKKLWKEKVGHGLFSWADLVGRFEQFTYLREPAQKSEHDRLVAAGVSLVRENVLSGTVVSMWKQDVEHHSPTWIKGFGHAYSVAGHMALAGMGKAAKENGYRSGISYVIEEGDEGCDHLTHLLSYSPKSPEIRELYQWAGHAVVAKTPHSPFHAPDLLAWEWGKFMLETVLQRKRPLRLSFAYLLRERLHQYAFQHLSGDSLLHFFRQVTEFGVQQMQEDADVSSVPAVDLGAALNASEQPEPSGGQE